MCILFVLAVAGCGGGDEDEGAGQGVQSFEQMVEADHRAVAAFVKGDPEPKKRLWSRSDEATLANPFGPPARGPKAVAKALERGASRLRDGEPLGFDRISHAGVASGHDDLPPRGERLGERRKRGPGTTWRTA